MNDLFLNLVGPLRITLLLFFLFFLKKLITKKKLGQHGLDYFVPLYVISISVTIGTGFILTQLNAYDLVTTIIIFFLFMTFIFLNLKRKKSILKQLQKIRNRIILYISKNFEDNKHLITRKNFKDTLSKRSTKEQRLKRLWQIAVGGFLGLFAFLSRYYYLQFDTFSFSDLWFVELSYVKDITAQHWFFVSDSMVGEYLIINLYAGLSGISDMIALRSFGLLESALLAIIIYWVVSKITITRRSPGLFAALFFIVLYKFLPLNLDLMTQHKSIFLALTLALPTLIFIIKPKLLKQNLVAYSRWMTYIFCAVLLTNLFVSLLFALYWSQE